MQSPLWAPLAAARKETRMKNDRRPRILVLSRNYPNTVTPVLGLWVEGLVRHVAKLCEVKVVAPVPYCPPLPGLNGFTRFRSVERQSYEDGFEVFHPRFITGPGYSTYNAESSLYYWSIRQFIDRLRRKFPFDLIHANFGYPDGVVAARLAARYKVPFIITEHAAWIPWIENYPKVRQMTVAAASRSSFHTAVSSFARDTISRFTGESERLKVIPNGVDTGAFRPNANVELVKPNQILYVGLTRRVKGIDILLAAMRRLVIEKPEIKLVLVGGGIYRDYQSHDIELRRMAEEYGLGKNIEFAGIKTPPEVARYMRESALLVLPSRTETFGAVLIEALACGTPVVATKCGGPEDFINDSVGRLVEKENPNALADAILEVVSKRDQFDPAGLSEFASSNYSWDRIAGQMVDLYRQAIIPPHSRDNNSEGI